MEIGHLGFDGNPGSGNGYGSISQDGETSRQKWVRRCEGFKQEGSMLCGDDVWRTPKVAKPDTDLSPAASTALLLDNSCGLAVASDADKLSVSCNSKPESSALAYFHHIQAAHTKNAGYYYSGGMNTSTGMYLVSGVRGPFTPSQWLELEQQALIYKYIIAKEPIPVHLLLSIRKAFESAGFYGFNGGTLKSTSWGWGPFHQGDPEPGRCRRTDGKKWRCSRDAVANQKYCEKHMNRGRHRSRKHVEGQSVSEANKSSTTKPIPPPPAASSTAPSVLPGGGSSNTFEINQHQHFQGKSLHPAASNPHVNTSLNRMMENRENSRQTLQDETQFSFLSQGTDLNCSGSSFSISKHQICSQERSLNGFGSYIQGESESRNSLHTYMDGGPDQLSIMYSDLKSQSGSTRLSMSVPMGPADFMSSTSSPINEKSDVSPLKLSLEHEMCIGFGSQIQSPRQANWKPISWEASMGGPLAEAFQSGNSYQLSSSSPTGVLHKGTLSSMTNSSTESSPRAGNSKTVESSGSLCTDLLGSATVN